MRITIEPTTEIDDEDLVEAGLLNHTVVLEHPSDDVDAEDALDMAMRALVAWGYHWESIFGEPREVVVGYDNDGCAITRADIEDD